MDEEQSHGIRESNKQMINAVERSMITVNDTASAVVAPASRIVSHAKKEHAKRKLEKKAFAPEEEKDKLIRKKWVEKKSPPVGRSTGIKSAADKKSVIVTEAKQSFGLKQKSAIKKQSDKNKAGVRTRRMGAPGKDLLKETVKMKRITEVLSGDNPAETVQELGLMGGRAIVGAAMKIAMNLIRAIATLFLKLAAMGLPLLVIFVPIIAVIAVIGANEGEMARRRAKQKMDVASGYVSFPPQVEQWRSMVVEHCRRNNDPNSDINLNLFVNPILALIYQESGGRAEIGDIMQCAESGYSLPMEADAWSEPEQSIDKGIRVFYDCLKNWNVKSPTDYEGLCMAAQAYNFGSGFLGWARQKGYTKYDEDMAAEYARIQARAHGWSSYGNYRYASQWLVKLQSANQAIMVNAAYEYHAYRQGNYTMQPSWACPVTALASAIRSLGYNVNPNDLEAHNYFDGKYWVGLYFRVPDGCEYWAMQNYPVDIERVPSSNYSQATINNALENGSLVLVYLHNGSQYAHDGSYWSNGKRVTVKNSHWLCLIGTTATGNYAAIDPGDGTGHKDFCKPENCEGGVVDRDISIDNILNTVNDMVIVSPRQ